MKKYIFSLLFIGFFLFGQNIGISNPSIKSQPDEVKLEWLNNWLAAWELVSNDVFNLKRTAPPIMIFYDETYVYTTSDKVAPNGKEFNGPDLFSQKLSWKKAEHKGKINLPDGQQVPVQLMTFAAPSDQKGVESFFVMAAPTFWQKAGISSSEAGLEKMLTGVFLHEFAHTRQMNGFGARVSEIEKQEEEKFKIEIDDDIIQNYFSKDDEYVKKFQKEVELFYSAAREKNIKKLKNIARKALKLLKKRQKKYLTRENNKFTELDNIFLSMEGTGQFAMVSWLNHPKGGNLPLDKAIKATRRGKSWWSQDEGLALFLVLQRLVKIDWDKDLFSENPTDIIKLLERGVDQLKIKN